jgi:N-acetylneuraminic acid mutarotase
MIDMIKSLRLCVAAVIAASCVVSAAHAQKWSTAAPFPEPAEEVYGIAAGGKFYVFGGLAPGWTPKGLVYEYDPDNNTWTKKKNMPLLSHHLGVAELNDKIYVMGGFTKPEKGPTAWVPINNAWEYDPASDAWKPLAPMPTKRGSPNAVAHKGKIYVIGGASVHPGSKESAVHPARPHRAVSANEVYDPATNTWETRQPMPTARNHAAAGVVNEKIYVIGGRIGAAYVGISTPTDIVEEYDPATDQWGVVKARMPTPRSAVAWGVYRGRIFVAGGEAQAPQFMMAFRAVEAYDPSTNRWSSLPQMPLPRHGLAGAVVGSRLHLVSGDIQSAGTGMEVHTDRHDVLDLEAK